MLLDEKGRRFRLITSGPAFIVLLLIFIVPIFYTLVLSFSKWGISSASRPVFVGLGNYIKLFSDNLYVNSLVKTAYFSIFGTLFQVIIGVSVAQFLNREFKGKTLLRTILILPLASTPVAISMVWKLMLHPTLGIINHFGEQLGFGVIEWLTTEHLVLFVLVLIDTWKWFPLIMLITISAMSSVPRELYESAVIDGASRNKSFFHITLPLIRPSIVVAAMIRITDSLKQFDMIYTITEGGPGVATKIMNLYIYDVGFQYFKMGYASSIVVSLFLIILIVNTVLFKVRKSS
jgi:multiple sugar transport system permease protein